MNLTSHTKTASPGVLLKQTTSICPTCLESVPAFVLERDGKVWMDKACGEHGSFSALLASDRAHYHVANHEIESLGSCCGPGQHCGDQVANHSCNMLIELTQQCNLTCPTCYAGSSPLHSEILPYERYVSLVDGLLAQGKGDADLIQLSGGEPTLHPQIFECIAYALDRGVKQVYVNTNGIRLAELEFAQELAAFGDRISVYLQFDGFKSETYATLRGAAGLYARKQKALENCEALGINVVPVMTLTRDVNDHDEVGAVLEMAAASQSSIRKVMIQPAMYSGRYDNPRVVERLTVADVANLVSEQTGVFTPEDFGPIPCSDPNCFAFAMALRTPGGLLPISRYFPRYKTWNEAGNAELIASVTDSFDAVSDLQSAVAWAVSTGALATLDEATVDTLLDAIVAWQSGEHEANWGGLLVIGVKPFMDAYTYDQDRIDKCCVHIIATDGAPVSFCEYNAIRRPRGNR